MKRVLLSVFTIILCLNVFGQRKVDISISLLAPANGTSINSLQPYPVTLQYKNNGPDSLIKGDSLIFEYSYGSSSSQTIDTPANILIFTGTLHNGDSGTFTFSHPLDLEGSTSGSILVCCELVAYIKHTGQKDSIDLTSTESQLVSCNTLNFEGSGIDNVSILRGSVSVHPNPAIQNTTFSYQTLTAGQVNLSLYDITGKLVTSVVNEYETPGKFEQNLNTENLKAGIYMYKLSTGDGAISGKLIIAN